MSPRPSIPGTALAAALLLPALAAAQQVVNPMHPQVTPLDAAGRPTAQAAAVAADVTCGACHDARFIGAHTAHGADRGGATCVQCHVDGGQLDVRPATLDPQGRLLREALRIGRPRARNCAACHGLVGDAAQPVVLRPELESGPGPDGRTFSLTLGEGAIVSSQPVAASFLDLPEKAARIGPWDVHAARLVDCAACHHAANDPSRGDLQAGHLRYVADDPRRPGTAEFLRRPDHRLATPDCRSCHDALASHAFLPYRARHLEVLACAACHAPGPVGPAAQVVDATVVTAAGRPAVVYRNVERRAGEALGTATVHPLRPLLALRREPDGALRLAPVNVVARWRWIDGASARDVPWPLVVGAYRDGDGYAAPILAALDADGDGRLEEAELRLTTPAQVERVAARLRATGVAAPEIAGDLEPHPLAHGIVGRTEALRDCAACHAAGGRLAGTYALAAYLPGGVAPRPPDGGRVVLAGQVVPTAAGGLALERADAAAPGALHVLGLSRPPWAERLGFGLFALVTLGVAAHGAARLALRRRRALAAPRVDPPPAYVFGRYERLWHWTMAGAGLALVATGLRIHLAGATGPLGLPTAVALHNAFAAVLMVNAFLALFYHLATAAIRSFLPAPRGLFARVLAHLAYQTRGIFLGAPHPEDGAKLNPLQQLTYLALLNVLFPLQIATGLLIWAVGHWPELAGPLHGLQVLAPVHALGAWLLLAFVVLHVYLVTTGRTAGEHLRAMVTGWRPAPPPEGDGAASITEGA